jgi:hypothetical protein
LAPRTLKRLEAITEGVKARSGVSVEPMQLAALLLEKTTEQLNEDASGGSRYCPTASESVT